MKQDNILNTKIRMMLLSYQNQEYEKAEKMAVSLSKDFPNVNLSWKIITAIYLKKGMLHEALKSNQKAIDINQADAEAHSNMGLIYMRLKKFNEALESCEKAIELKPDYAEVYFNKTVLLRNLDRLTEAEKSCRMAIQFKPNFSEAHSNLGIILHKLNKLDEAERHYKKAIEINPNYVSAKNNLDTLVKQNNLLKIIKVKQQSKDQTVKDLFKTSRNVENNLIENLYQIKTKQLDDVDPEILRYGNGESSDYNLFKSDNLLIKKVEEDLNNLLKKLFNSEIFILESFFNIFKEGSGIVRHNHVSNFDKENGLNNNKYSLVYYLSIGDQSGKDPGFLKLYNPEVEILPTNGMIMIFPADRFHKSTYSGNKDRVMIGVNFYTLN